MPPSLPSPTAVDVAGRPRPAARPRRQRLAAAALLLAACGGDPAPNPPPPPPATVAPAQPPGHHRMLALLRDLANRSQEDHIFFGKGRARELRADLARLGAAAPWKAHLDAGLAELLLGNEREGIDILAATVAGLELGTIAGDRDARNSVHLYLGVAWMRLGETQNCCAVPTAESCILPLRGSALHQKKEGSAKAIDCFLDVLAHTERTDYWHLAALWLLNLAHMTLGTFPDGVPEAHRLPASAFTSAIEFPHFSTTAPQLGLDAFNLAGGVILDDFDGDGFLDIMSSTWHTEGQLRFYRNQRDGSFAERTTAAGLDGLYGGLNLNQADYDNDGDLDVLVLRGAWLHETGRHPKSLLRNNGDGTFTDVTFAAGLGAAYYPTQTAAWADYDNDGDLDLYAGSENSPRVQELASKAGEPGFPCQLFRNNGDGTFTDVAAAAGVANYGFAKGTSWGDYDNDRWPDLYVSNLAGDDRLYHNRGDGTFTDVAKDLGAIGPRDSFPTWFWDFDNDGALDLFVSDYGTGIGHIAAHHLGIALEHDIMRMFRGDGHGGFHDAARELGLTYPAVPMGCNFGDLDNDGFLDFYLGTGDPHFYSLMPNLMFLNDHGRRFVDVTMAGGFGHLQKGHAVAFADLDHDGDLDLFTKMGGAFPGDRFRDAFYENPGFGNCWVTLHLRGTKSNRCAIGARIRIDVDEGGAVRSIYRHVNSGGSFGANPLRQTIGLGQAARIVRCEVFWPTTGTTQPVDGLALDHGFTVVEGQPGCTPLELPRVTLRH